MGSQNDDDAGVTTPRGLGATTQVDEPSCPDQAGLETITQESICNVALAGDDHVVIGLVGGSKTKVRGSLRSCDSEAMGIDKSLTEKYYLTLDNGRRLTIDKSHIAADDMKVIAGMSTPGGDRKSHISLRAIVDKSKDLEKSKVQRKRLTLMVVALVVLCAVLCAGMFATTVAAMELTKEVLVKDGVLEDRTGGKVKVSSADFSVTQNGALVKTTEDANSTAETAVIATKSTKTESVLSSSLADEFFEALEEVTVHSNKGHYLTVKVHGFARIPVLNSRCGNIVHLFSAWGHKMTLDSNDLSFDPDLSAIFENAGFELAVGGVGGRRLSAPAAIAGFFNHIENRAEVSPWTCGDVPLPKFPQSYFYKFTQYQACSEGDATFDSCDSKYGGQLPGVATLPPEHQWVMFEKIDQIKASLGHPISAPTNILYWKKETTVMKSEKYQVETDYWLAHPTMEFVRILDFEKGESVKFQRSLIGTLIHRLWCENGENVTESPDYKATKAAGEGIDMTMHFEFLGLEEVNQVMYRHFRMMSSDDFHKWIGGTSEQPNATIYEYWDHSETLAPYRMLNPEAGLIVFEQVTDNMTDAEVESILENFMRASEGMNDVDSLSTSPDFTTGDSLTAPCNAIEKSGFSVDHTEKVPKASQMTLDLDPAELDFYAMALVDPETEATNETGGYANLASMKSDNPYYSFAQYALRAQEFYAMADPCALGCSDELAGVKDYIKLHGKGALCESPALSELVMCWGTLGPLTSKVCEISPFAKRVTACYAEADPRRLQQEGLKATDLPDGTKKVDLTQLSWKTRAEIARNTGVDVLAKNAYIYFNETDDEQTLVAPPAVVETVSADGSAVTRRLGNEDINWASCFNSGRWCFVASFPTGCTDNACVFYLMIAIYWRVDINGDLGGRLAIEAGGSINALNLIFPAITNPPLYGTVSAWGSVSFGWTQVCAQIPFSLSGEVGVGVALGINLVLFQQDLAKVWLTLSVSNQPMQFWDWFAEIFCLMGFTQYCPTGLPDCDIAVAGTVGIQLAVVKGYLTGTYYVLSEVFKLVMDLEVYIGIGWFGYWQHVGSWTLVDSR